MRKILISACAVLLTAGMAWGQEETVTDLYIRFNQVPDESGLLTGTQGDVNAPKAITFDGATLTDAYVMDVPQVAGGVYTKTMNLPAGNYEYQVVKADGNAATTSTQLPIASIREGEVSGIHSIRYESEADIITITHEAKNRKGFALGAVLAAEYAHTHNGLLNMNDLFKL